MLASLVAAAAAAAAAAFRISCTGPAPNIALRCAELDFCLLLWRLT